MEVHNTSLDLGAPTFDVIIDGSLIDEVQIDSESCINLMSYKTIEELDSIKLKYIPIILKMSDQSRVKPLRILSSILTTMGGIDFKVTYIAFKVVGINPHILFSLIDHG